jgi:hypothetical protein
VNAWLATRRARTVWVHTYWPFGGPGNVWAPPRSEWGPCEVNECDDWGLPTMIGFGPGTNDDPSSFVVTVTLCDKHARRATQEATTVRERRRPEVWARALLGLE